MNDTKHHCKKHTTWRKYGQAVTYCFEAEDGTFWAGNEWRDCPEGAVPYECQVNYCPFCGTAAPKPYKKDESLPKWIEQAMEDIKANGVEAWFNRHITVLNGDLIIRNGHHDDQ